jgi:hypothetical protein
MKDQEEFAIGGMVSVRVGNFADDVHFDDYMNLSAEFGKDFGFRINDRSVREAVVESVPTLIVLKDHLLCSKHHVLSRPLPN